MTFRRLPELGLKPFIGKIIDHEHRLAVVLPLLLLRRHLAFLHLDMVFLAKLLHRLDERALLDLHHKLQRVSAGSTAETFVDTFRRTNRKRTRLLVVERTQPNEVCAALFERDVIAYDLFYLSRSIDAFYGFSRNQFSITNYQLSAYHR